MTTEVLNLENIDFKMLSEKKIASLQSGALDNGFAIILEDDLTSAREYIMMVLMLEDINGEEVILDEELYDFNTATLALEQETVSVDEELAVDTEEEVVLNAADEEMESTEEAAEPTLEV